MKSLYPTINVTKFNKEIYSLEKQNIQVYTMGSVGEGEENQSVENRLRRHEDLLPSHFQNVSPLILTVLKTAYLQKVRK